MSDKPTFRVIDGQKSDDDSRPFIELPVTVYEETGLRVICKPGQTPLYEVEHEVFDAVADADLSIHGVIVRLGLEHHTGQYEPGEAASLILSAMEARGILSKRRGKLLEGIPAHAHEMVQDNVPEYDILQGWVERWWTALV